MTTNLKSEPIKKCNRLIEIAGSLTEDGQPQKSIEELLKIERENKSLIQSSPYLIAGLNIELGMAYYHLDKAEGDDSDVLLEKAVEHFSIMLNIKEAAENVRFMRAKCYDYLGKFKEAKADYQRVIELNPKAECAHAFLGLLMENQGYLAEAKKLYLEALSLDPSDEMSAGRLKVLEGK